MSGYDVKINVNSNADAMFPVGSVHFGPVGAVDFYYPGYGPFWDEVAALPQHERWLDQMNLEADPMECAPRALAFAEKRRDEYALQVESLRQCAKIAALKFDELAKMQFIVPGFGGPTAYREHAAHAAARGTAPKKQEG